ncbi:MAG: hypothetical protein ACRDTC_22215 [Pseudonocardiaceae bacterium]
MTAQPEHPSAPETSPRVPRTIDGIADALTGARRMEFYRAVGQAQAGPDLQYVIATWWGQAMLDPDPDPDHRRSSGRHSADPHMAEVLHRRRAVGAATAGE